MRICLRAVRYFVFYIFVCCLHFVFVVCILCFAFSFVVFCVLCETREVRMYMLPGRGSSRVFGVCLF